MVNSALSFVIGTLSRSFILLAFSEFIFANEEPVKAVIVDGSIEGSAAKMAGLILFYCIPGALLFVLEPKMTTWPKVLFGGAFVGWSTEAAIVPAAYEAIPVSYFWTSVSWHAVWDVALGCYILVLAMQRGWHKSLPMFAALGVFWGIWVTWTWDVLKLDLTQFALLAALVTVLLLLGYLMFRPAQESSRTVWWAVVIINLLLWAIWILPIPLPALGLALLAGVTAWLMSFPSKRETIHLPDQPVGLKVLAILPLPLAAMGTYALILMNDVTFDTELMVAGIAILGFLLFVAAVVSALIDRIRRPRAT